MGLRGAQRGLSQIQGRTRALRSIALQVGHLDRNCGQRIMQRNLAARERAGTATPWFRVSCCGNRTQTSFKFVKAPLLC